MGIANSFVTYLRNEFQLWENDIIPIVGIVILLVLSVACLLFAIFFKPKKLSYVENDPTLDNLSSIENRTTE